MNAPAPDTALYHVTVEPSGRHFDARADETLLAAAIRAGLTLPYGCQDGACGACKCQMLSGTVSHGQHSSNALSGQEEQMGLILPCCAHAHSDVVLESKQVAAANALPVKKMPARVQILEHLTPDVMRLQLQIPANEVFAYYPGQYIEFLLRDGLRRAYSLANAESNKPGTPLELHIRHMSGGVFTDQVFGTLKVRDILRIEGPFGSFYLREESVKPIILLASGTGFAPIKAILEFLQVKGSTRPTTLYWGGRRPHDLYLDAWVREQQTHWPHLSYVPVVSDALPEDCWTGRTGVVHLAVLQDYPSLADLEVYACGAPVMVAAAKRDFAQHGLPEDAFFADAFTSAADKV